VTLREHVPALARALDRAFREHGQPNTFTPGELEALYGAPDALVQGRIGRDPFLMSALAGELARLGWGAATKPTYTPAAKRDRDSRGAWCA
jgi:hypothetical protein